MKTQALLASLMIVSAGIGGIAAIGGVASAMSSRPSTSVKPTGDRDRCFDSQFIRGFQTPNDHTVIIISDRNQAYELQLGGVCIGLDSSFAIGVRPRHGMDEICGAFDADIVYEGMDRHSPCPVTSVRHLTGDEAAPYVNAPGKDKKKYNDASAAAASSSASGSASASK